VEVELFQDSGDQAGAFAVLADAIEGVTCSLDRQCWDFQSLTVRRDRGDAGGNTKTNVAEAAQLLHNSVDLLPTGSPQTEDRFCVVEDNEHLL